jgi:hypothetical protein
MDRWTRNNFGETDKKVRKYQSCYQTVNQREINNTMAKMANNDVQNITQKTIDRATRSSLKTGSELEWRGKQFLLHMWHPSYYSWYKPADKSWKKNPLYSSSRCLSTTRWQVHLWYRWIKCRNYCCTPRRIWISIRRSKKDRQHKDKK